MCYSNRSLYDHVQQKKEPETHSAMLGKKSVLSFPFKWNIFLLFQENFLKTAHAADHLQDEFIHRPLKIGLFKTFPKSCNGL